MLANCELGVSITVGDIPNRYTSDVVLYQQARVAHRGGMADCLLGGPVAGSLWRILDAGAYGGSEDTRIGLSLGLHIVSTPVPL
jgi:hypothetical protein